MRKRTRPITAIPPTTPPAMAPLFGCFAPGAGVAVAVGRGADAFGLIFEQEM
jgi:hypothetical protein